MFSLRTLNLENTKVTLKRLLGYVKPYTSHVVISLISSIVSVGLTLLIPVLIGKAVDKIVDTGNVDFNYIFKMCLLIASCILGVAVFQWLTGTLTSRLSYNTVKDIRKDLIKKLNSVPLNFIDTTPHGDIISRIINDADALGDGLLQGFTQLFTGTLTILGTLIFMLSLNYQIALLVMVITPVSLLVTFGITRFSAKRFSRQAAIQGEVSSYVEEMVSNQKLLIAFSNEEDTVEEFEKINSRLYTAGEKAQFSSSIGNPSTRFINTIIYALVGLTGSFAAIGGHITVGTVSAFLTYSNQYTKPFNEISGIIWQIQSAFAGARRIFETLDEPNEVPEGKNAAKLLKARGDINIDDISFSYVPKQNLIENFSLKVTSGQKVAIVGPTGSGKTTIINLLMRFYELESGKIFVDGKNITDITRNSLRKLYGMVLQESWLYSATIKENIAYGKPNATDDEIIKAAKDAYAHEFIMQTEHGYDTVLTLGGESLSSGQKQLLCIARVLLCNPSMLILDEATSSIDTLTEQRVVKAFNKMMTGRTSFIVAHRLSTIQNADVILVLKDGNIIEQGTHLQLLAKKGFYYHLFKSQFAQV